jgi:hypothetical protein
MSSVIVELLRSEELQRLRRIRQLGLAHFVFPGAEHSRLAHCLGAAFVATLFGKQVSREAEDLLIDPLVPHETAIRDLAVAALCHDLGHGPFSHAWEREVITKSWDRVAWCKALGVTPTDPVVARAKWHELVGYAFLGWPDGTLYQMLEAQEKDSADRLRRFIAGQYYLTYLPRLISSDVDVDRSDFLLRDSLMTGVGYGKFDLQWIISHTTLGTCEIPGQTSRRWVVGFEKGKALYSVEHVLVARRALYRKVYHHKSVRSVEALLGKFLRRLTYLARAGRLPVDSYLKDSPVIRVASGAAVPPEDLLNIDDYTLWGIVTHLASSPRQDPIIANLARRLNSRDLLKRVAINSDRLEEYFQEHQDAWPTVLRIVGKYTAEPEYFSILDRPDFTMLETDDSQCAYLIDTRDSSRTAKRLKDHGLFSGSATREKSAVRLFVPHEARDKVREEIAKVVGE